MYFDLFNSILPKSLEVLGLPILVFTARNYAEQTVRRSLSLRIVRDKVAQLASYHNTQSTVS